MPLQWFYFAGAISSSQTTSSHLKINYMHLQLLCLLVHWKNESCHDANIFATGGTACCRHDNSSSACDVKVGIVTTLGSQCRIGHGWLIDLSSVGLVYSDGTTWLLMPWLLSTAIISNNINHVNCGGSCRHGQGIWFVCDVSVSINGANICCMLHQNISAREVLTFDNTFDLMPQHTLVGGTKTSILSNKSGKYLVVRLGRLIRLILCANSHTPFYLNYTWNKIFST